MECAILGVLFLFAALLAVSYTHLRGFLPGQRTGLWPRIPGGVGAAGPGRALGGRQMCIRDRPQVIEQFGYTRTLYVLANTVQQKEWDGRFSPANKTWAKTVDIPPNPDGFGGERNLDFVVDGHPGLVDLFLSQARQDYLRLQPLTPEEIHAEAARLLQELRAPDTPNSPHGTHYTVSYTHLCWPTA